MRSMKKIIVFLSVIFVSSLLFAQSVDKDSLCPVQRWVGDMTGAEFADRFIGDTIIFSIPDAKNAYFESFLLLYPDTVWLKKKPTDKRPQAGKHYALHKNFEGISGWGVNAHREYTCGSVLDGHYFVLRGRYSEEIPYLGKFDYVLLEDCYSRKIIKWDPTKFENNGVVIYSPSIDRHLSLMKGHEFLIEETDSTYLPAKCTDAVFSVEIKNRKWNSHLVTYFSIDKGLITSNNWCPRFFLRKDENKLINERTEQ